MKRILAALAVVGLTTAGLLGAAAPANATVAYATTDLNMRAGPGTRYHRVAVIPVSHPVRILDCIHGSSWCQVSFRGHHGWASSRYLSVGGARYHARPPVYVHPPTVYRAPSFQFYFGTGRHYYPRRHYYRRHHYHRRHHW